MKRLAAAFAFAVTVAMSSGVGGFGLPAGAGAAAASTPIPHPAQTAPPELAAPSPTPLPLLINGQVVDFERGYIVFSSGDAFRVAPEARTVDAATGAQPTYAIEPGIFAVAVLEPSSALVTLIRTSRRPLPQGTPAAQIPRQYVAAASSPKPNPDLVPRRSLFESRLSHATLVTITVQVPPNTPFTDDVYLATDTSGWNAQAIKMQRVDGLHFRIQSNLAAGTEFRFLFTRGTWKTVERDQAGLQRRPRTLFASGGDVQVIDATVYRWADLP